MASSSDRSTLHFSELIEKYSNIQAQVLTEVQDLAQNMESATPGKFLLVQFKMSQVTQVGESISNMIQQVNSVINATVRNQKVQ